MLSHTYIDIPYMEHMSLMDILNFIEYAVYLYPTIFIIPHMKYLGNRVVTY